MKTLDMDPHNPGECKPLSGHRILRKCELRTITSGANLPGLYFNIAGGWCPSTRVGDNTSDLATTTYATEKPFGWYAPPVHPELSHPAGFRGLTTLERDVLETKSPTSTGPMNAIMFIRKGRYNQGTVSAPRWVYNEYARDFVYANTSADPGPGCGTYGEVSVPEGWDVNKDVIVVSTEESSTPAPEPEVHNPGNIPGPGPGHRFLTKDEFNKLGARFGFLETSKKQVVVPGLQFWSRLTNSWNYFFGESGCYVDPRLTHRVPNDWVFPETANPGQKTAPATCCSPSVFCAGAEAGTVDFATPYAATKVISKLAGDFSALQSRAENAEKELALLRDQLAKADRVSTEVRRILCEFCESATHNRGITKLGAFEYVLTRPARAVGIPESDASFRFVIKNEPVK